MDNQEPLATDEKRQFSAGKFDIINGMMMDPRISGNTFQTGVCIVQHLNARTFTAWPSRDVIAAELGISRTTVNSAIKKLEKYGWLSIEKTGTNKAAIYSMNAAQLGGMKESRDMRVAGARDLSRIRSEASYRRRLLETDAECVDQELAHTKQQCGSTFVPCVDQLSHSVWTNSCTETPLSELPTLTPSILQGGETNLIGACGTSAIDKALLQHIRCRMAKQGFGFQQIKQIESDAQNQNWGFDEINQAIDELSPILTTADGRVRDVLNLASPDRKAA